MPIPRPSTLGRYRIEREVGRGGFAVVYQAYDHSLGRKVAIKVPHPWLLSDPKSVERFHREARLAANLTHPHIVTIYEIGDEQGTPFIAMEWLEGVSFQDWLRKAQPIPQASLQALSGAGAALDYAHARQIIHRDIKPSNIMMVAGRGGVLTDFGIARSLVQASQSTSNVMGTPNYMAPEVLKGQAATAASDIYALGVILFEILTGRPPFFGDTPNAVAYQHANVPPPDPRSINPTLPKPAAVLVLQALAKDPRQRPVGAERLIRELLARSVAPVAPGKQRLPWAIGGAAILLALILLMWGVIDRFTSNQIEPTQVANVATPLASTTPTRVLTNTLSPATHTTSPTQLPISTIAPTSQSTSTPLPTGTPKPLPTGTPKPPTLTLKPPAHTPATSAPLLSGPTNLQPTDLETVLGKIQLAWSDINGSVGYVVETRTNSAGSSDWRRWGPVASTLMTISFDDDVSYFHTPGTIYFWRVAAVDASGRTGLYSEVRSFVFQRDTSTGTSFLSEQPNFTQALSWFFLLLLGMGIPTGAAMTLGFSRDANYDSE